MKVDYLQLYSHLQPQERSWIFAGNTKRGLDINKKKEREEKVSQKSVFGLNAGPVG